MAGDANLMHPQYVPSARWPVNRQATETALCSSANVIVMGSHSPIELQRAQWLEEGLVLGAARSLALEAIRVVLLNGFVAHLAHTRLAVQHLHTQSEQAKDSSSAGKELARK